MRSDEFRRARQSLGLSQERLAEKLGRTRRSVIRYEDRSSPIPAVVAMAFRQLASPPGLPLAGLVAAGNPIEPVPQFELVDVPPSMLRGGENFALQVKGDSMRDAGIREGDALLVRRQANAREGDIVVATIPDEVTGEPRATIKRLPRNGGTRLLPENPAYEPIENDEITIIGKVMGLWRAPV